MTFSSRLIVLGVVLTLFIDAKWMLYVKARNAGRHQVQALWDAQVKAAELQVLQEEKRQQKANAKIVTNVVANAAKGHAIYRDIINEIRNYVPTYLSVLPGSSRELHAAV
ncbi:MAG: hypothetical protein ACK5AJ_06900 [bacterium]|jgi:hypothetical protein